MIQLTAPIVLPSNFLSRRTDGARIDVSLQLKNTSQNDVFFQQSRKDYPPSLRQQ